MAESCGRRTKSCRICKYRFSKAEHSLWNCPGCGEYRGCTQKVSEPGKACRYHGGKSLKGVVHPQFKGGKYSKYMPTGMAGRYASFMEDSDRLTLADETAILQTLLADYLDKLAGLAHAGAWAKANEVFENIGKAAASGQEIRVGVLMAELGDILINGTKEGVLVKDIQTTIEQIRRNKETEGRMAEKSEQLIPLSDFVAFVDATMYLLRTYVKPLSGSGEALRQGAHLFEIQGATVHPE